jgi:hypothetical protein
LILLAYDMVGLRGSLSAAQDWRQLENRRRRPGRVRSAGSEQPGKNRQGPRRRTLADFQK